DRVGRKRLSFLVITGFEVDLVVVRGYELAVVDSRIGSGLRRNLSRLVVIEDAPRDSPQVQLKPAATTRNFGLFVIVVGVVIVRRQLFVAFLPGLRPFDIDSQLTTLLIDILDAQFTGVEDFKSFDLVFK